MSMCKTVALAWVSLLAMAPAPAILAAETPDLKDDPLTSPRTAWFREAKFGMFIHWGLYAVPASVRYMVITSKHHDGFCMFDAAKPVKE